MVVTLKAIFLIVQVGLAMFAKHYPHQEKMKAKHMNKTTRK